MLSRFFFLFCATQMALVAALGQIMVANRCSKDMYIWSVDGDGSRGPFRVPARSKYFEPVRSSCDGCGVSIKVSKSDQLVAGEHTQFEYSMANNVMFYDISYVNCAQGEDASNCPAHIAGHQIYSPNEGACDRVTCFSNTYCPTQAYYVDTPLSKLGIAEPVYGCGNSGTNMDLTFVLCQNQRYV